MRTIQLTVTMAAAVPESWDAIPSADIKARAEKVAEDTIRRVFAPLQGLTVATATATVEGGDHE